MSLYLDNIIFSLQRTGGISAVWANLIECLSHNDIDYKCLEYGKSPNIYRKVIDIPENRIIQYDESGLSYKRYLQPDIDINTPSVFHSSYYRTYNSPIVKNITTVHDFTYEYYTNGPKAWIHKWQKFHAIRKSDKIVCISQNTKKDLLRFLPEISTDKISVIYNGVSDSYYPLTQAPFAEYSNYLMFVGARGGYKNFDFAIETAKVTGHKLLICGNPLNDKEKRKLSSIIGDSGFISLVRPTNEVLNELYNSVFALIYPSSYEGFGIPVLEAQKAGCPVISLNASSIPEIIGEGYPMLDRLTLKSVEEINKILNNSSARDNIIKVGKENAKRFSWDEMGKQYIELYKSLQ